MTIEEEQLDAGLDAVVVKRDLEADLVESRALAERLPGLRASSGFPTGTDEAILAMSRPRSYTACPNPYGEDLVSMATAERQERTPYAADITIGKTSLTYKAHIYPTKVPHEAIMRFLLHYTDPGDLVLDGFCGSGMTGVAAQSCGSPNADVKAIIQSEMPSARWGARKAFLQDLAPNATFLAAGLNLPVDADAFDRASSALLKRFDEEWGWMYETTSPSGAKATIDYTIWSEVFTCPHCAGAVEFYEAAFDRDALSYREHFVCPSCGASVSKSDLHRRRTPTTTLAGDQIERIEFRPVQICYRIGKTTGMKAPDAADIAVLRKIASTHITGFPQTTIPHLHMTHERANFPALGFAKVHHFWPDRAGRVPDVLEKL